MDHQRSPLKFVRTPRRPRIAAFSLSLATAAVLVAGCGAEGSDPGSVTPQDAATGPATDLTVEVTDGRTTTWTLTCDPVGGDHPDAEAACAALEKNGGKAVAAADADAMCTQIFGGDQTAVLSGVWKGKAIDATFSRKDGCEVSRWDELAPLLPKVAT